MLESVEPIQDKIKEHRKMIMDKLQEMPEGKQIYEDSHRSYEMVSKETKPPINKKFVSTMISEYNNNHDSEKVPSDFIAYIEEYRKNNRKKGKPTLKIVNK